MTKATQSKFKIAGLIVILIPIGFLGVFAIGETLGGDISGLSHLIQAAPFVFIAIWSWKNPLAGGWAALVLASALLIISSAHLNTAVLIGIILTLISGLLFLAAARFDGEKDLYEKNV